MQEVIYVYEKINAPSIITPITPVNPIVTPTVKPTKISNTGNTAVSKGELPKTGELENMKLSIVGLGLSMGIFSIFYKNYKKNEIV